MKYTQKGSALAVSLVLLTAITLISLSSMQRSGLQTKIVSNLQHHEILFQTTLNEQEYWWGQLQKDDSKGKIISEAQDEYTFNIITKTKTYSPMSLSDNSGFNSGGVHSVVPNSQMLIIPPILGELALSEGTEINLGIETKLQISSSTNGGRPNLVANQLTGVTVDTLNNTKNSL
ncbi:MAG: pilus assembly PilX N-terminal domain-containing protein [Oleispira sp.]